MMFDDMTLIARTCIGTSVYKLGANDTSAPRLFDCSSFTQWLYKKVGVVVPRLAREQHDTCFLHLPAVKALPGDLLFRKCRYPRYIRCPILDIGHVGFVTRELTVIHASWAHGTVVEESLLEYFEFKARGLWAGRIHQTKEGIV